MRKKSNSLPIVEMFNMRRKRKEIREVKKEEKEREVFKKSVVTARLPVKKMGEIRTGSEKIERGIRGNDEGDEGVEGR